MPVRQTRKASCAGGDSGAIGSLATGIWAFGKCFWPENRRTDPVFGCRTCDTDSQHVTPARPVQIDPTLRIFKGVIAMDNTALADVAPVTGIVWAYRFRP